MPTYIGNVPATNAGALYVRQFSGNGVTTSFLLDTPPAALQHTAIYVNGLYQNKGAAYNLSGQNIVFTVAPGTGTNNIEVVITEVAPLTHITAGSSIVIDNSTNATYYLEMTSQTVGTTLDTKIATTKLTFNPSTGVLSSTEFNALSDAMYKTDIKSITNGTSIVSKLRGVTFKWKETGLSSVGVIAQELEQVLPELVTTSLSGRKSVNYNGLIGVLISAIQELNARIKVLESK